MRVRGAVHFALAIRGSRVAAYDLRETLAGATPALPADFIAAAGLVGDASCLDAIAAALAAPPSAVDDRDQRWRDDLVRAGRAIVQRERLTQRPRGRPQDRQGLAGDRRRAAARIRRAQPTEHWGQTRIVGPSEIRV